MNILISWTGLTGYTGSNWRALQRMPGVKVKVFVEPTAMDQAFTVERELGGLDVTVLEGRSFDKAAVATAVEAFRPDVMLIVGWHAKSCRWFATNRTWRNVPKVLVCDMPFAWTPRKILARIVLAGYLRYFAAAFVPGEPAARYMRWLGFGGRRPIFTGLNATNLRRFRKPRQKDEDHSARFLYVGRYSAEKGLDVLVEAYGIYRSKVRHPWMLDCVGTGEEASRLQGVEGLNDLGFRSPAQLADVYAGHAAFVLPSRHEPWGVVLAEAAGAGLPIVCTSACGARHELVREMQFAAKKKLQGGDACGNGLVVPAGDANALAAALERIHHLTPAERKMAGAAGMRLAEPFSSEAWAKRVVEMVGRLTNA